MNPVAVTVPWPDAAVDRAALRDGGWRPVPFREFVLKVHQRCNLACDYCYVYTLADQSWRSRPALMSERVWRAAVERIATHLTTHRLTEVSVILHGGEPLLAGADRLVAIARAVRAAVPAGTDARIGMQTNGVLLTPPTLRQLAEEDIRIGVSLDGTTADNDTHRRYADGRGSADAVTRALHLLTSAEYRPLFSGLLCTVDPGTDPVAAYEALLAFRPPAIDVLLPHANWDTGLVAGPGAFGDWLVRLFDRWYGAPRQETRIRFFEAILSLVLGGASNCEHVGLSPAAVAVVDSDGAIEQTDALKSAYEGAAGTGLSVLTDDFDAALEHPGMVSRQIGLRALSDECHACELKEICGGGHFAHRYRTGNGFRNPSVYCVELARLIGHVRRRVEGDLRRGRPQ